MSAEMRYDEAAQVILRDGVAVADIVDGKVRLRPEHKRLAIVVGKFWKGLCAPAAESAQPVVIPSPADTVTVAGFVKQDDDFVEVDMKKHLADGTMPILPTVTSIKFVETYLNGQGIPPMPPIDPMLGTKTPAVVEWYRTYKPEEWANMHKGWSMRNYLELPKSAGNLKRDALKKDRFEYLSREDSQLYLKVCESTDPKDVIIREFLEQKAADCRIEDCRETY